MWILLINNKHQLRDGWTLLQGLVLVHWGLRFWLSSSDGRHVPGRWAKSWHWCKGEKQQSQEVKNGGIREIHHHPTSLTLCRAWPYQAAGLSEWPNQVVGRAARPAAVWEHAQPWLHQSSWYTCINEHVGGLKVTNSPFFHIHLGLFFTQTAQWREGFQWASE